jgi:hypothetical protein
MKKTDKISTKRGVVRVEGRLPSSNVVIGDEERG